LLGANRAVPRNYNKKKKFMTWHDACSIGLQTIYLQVPVEAQMPGNIEIKRGQSFQDGTGLSVRVQEVDASHRVHFSVVQDGEVERGGQPGEMSYFAFVQRFTRIESVERA
jgi:hypothetical protein